MQNTPSLPLQTKEPLKFTQEQRNLLDFQKIPKHIAIIPDGNRRWARKRLSSIQSGHREGADILMDIVKAAREIGVKEITFYGFSTENWHRPHEEVMMLMALYAEYIREQRQEMLDFGIKLETIGDLNALPLFLQESIRSSREATQSCSDITLILALNYGSRDEMCRAIKALARDCESGKISSDCIDEKLFSSYLDTSPWSDPDLLIRTSGELRLSNFLLWQISYTEIYSAAIFWPDFEPKNLLEAIINYQNRQRRWGGCS